MTTKNNILANASQSYTFASHTSQRTDQSLQKSMHAPPALTEKKALVVTAPTKNWRLSASYDSFVVIQTLVLRMNICGKNRQLLVAANR
jgi:hypothetical protein